MNTKRMITIRVNDTQIKIGKTTNVQQLLQIVNTTSDGIAVAVNNQIVSKHLWESHRFNNNDNILIITATQGG